MSVGLRAVRRPAFRAELLSPRNIFVVRPVTCWPSAFLCNHTLEGGFRRCSMVDASEYWGRFAGYMTFPQQKCVYYDLIISME